MKKRTEVSIARAFVTFARLEQRRGPSARDLASALGIKSSSGGAHWIGRLAFAGLIQPVPGSSPGDALEWQLSDAGIAALAEAREKMLESV